MTALAARKLIAMVEPLPARREADGTVRISKDPDELVRLIGVASGLGNTSAYTWLKMHVTDDVERVLDATTLPTLLLGGDPGDRPAEVFEGWKRALRDPAGARPGRGAGAPVSARRRRRRRGERGCAAGARMSRPLHWPAGSCRRWR